MLKILGKVSEMNNYLLYSSIEYMRIFILVINYSILLITVLALLSLLEEFDIEVVFGAVLMGGLAIPNVIYAHSTKSIDTEKDDLKKEIEKLKNDNNVSKI